MAHLPRLCESVHQSMCQLRRMVMHLRHDWRYSIPAQCPLCAGHASMGGLCTGCHELVTRSMREPAPRCVCCRLALDGQGQCPDCAANMPAFDRIVAAFDYAAPADVLIHRFKVSCRFTDAPMLGKLLADEVVRTWPDFPADQVLVPVPSSRQAIRRRGFNPAAEVARVLARRLGRRYCPEMLCRVQEGHKQATLSREERMIGTSELYQVAVDVRGARIAVIDDVLTTGSTMHSIARMLKRSGAVSVSGLVLARTPRVL